jgi:hypothetical protein
MWRLLSTLMLASMFVSQAQASITCKRIEQLPPVSDPQVTEKIDIFARTNYRPQTVKIHQLDSRRFVLRPDD